MDFQNTRLNARTTGRKADYDQYGWGQTTPREMSNLMIKFFMRKN